MYRIIKRGLDFLMSFVLFIILLPLFLILMILTKLTSKGSVFYLHSRIGKNGKPFRVLKFRTMHDDPRPIEEILSPEQYREFLKNFKLKDDPRVTKFGKFMRKTSLDEIPQLLNILCGQMSFVGPRPVTEKEIGRLSEEQQRKYLSVPPGLTSFWAVHGRSRISYHERMNLELFYVEHQSLWLDLKVFVKTFFVFFKNSE